MSRFRSLLGREHDAIDIDEWADDFNTDDEPQDTERVLTESEMAVRDGLGPECFEPEPTYPHPPYWRRGKK